MPVIGFLGTATPSGWGQWVAATEQRLRELGWIVGRNLAIEYRWADGRSERYSEIAEEFVHLKVDVILTSGGAVLQSRQHRQSRSFSLWRWTLLEAA
jgi:putative ABC transport system substrate-binding protein